MENELDNFLRKEVKPEKEPAFIESIVKLLKEKCGVTTPHCLVGFDTALLPAKDSDEQELTGGKIAFIKKAILTATGYFNEALPGRAMPQPPQDDKGALEALKKVGHLVHYIPCHARVLR